MKTFALLSTAALLAARETAAQLDAGAAQCEAQLVAMSSAMNGACCQAPSDCSSGSPTQCSSACATTFMPFYSQCAAFVSTNLPELIAPAQLRR